MTQPAKLYTLTALSLACTMLVGCGGGDAEAPPAATAAPAIPAAPAPADTTAPTVTIANDVAAPTATGTVTFTFVFSEDVGTSFDATDVVVAGGSKGAFTRSSGSQATLVVIPTDNATGTLDVSVAAGKFIDIAGNANTATASASKPYNTVPVPAPAPPPVTPTGTVLVSFDEATAPTLTDFGVNGAPPTIVADPAGGTNKVLKVMKFALPAPGSEQWAGVTVSKLANAAITAIPFSATAKTMTLRVYSPAVGVRIRIKVEDAGNPGISCETDAISTTAGAWETLTFNFASPGLAPPVGGGATAALDLTKTYNKVSIFSDFGIGNGGSGPLPADRAYYYDDLTFVTAAAAPAPAPAGSSTIVSFDETTAPKLTDFGVNGAPPVIAVDPAGGTNKVLKVFKFALPAPGSEQWAGVTVSNLASDALPTIPFSATAKTLTLRTYSPAIGVRVRMKVENAANPGVSVETDALTTKANAWETLTFNFANPGLAPPVGGGATAALDLTKTYNKLSIFSDFGIGNGGSGPLPADRVYYYDDIAFVGGTTTSAGSGGTLIFASDYATSGVAAKTAEGGDAGAYIDGAVATAYAWGGVASLKDVPPPATPSFYFGWGLKANAKPGYLGGYVKAPANGVANLTGYTNLNLTVWGNDELVNTKPTFTIILKGPTVSGCTSELKGSVSVAAGGVQTYNVPLSSFTLLTACAYANAAAALAAGVTEVHTQVIGSAIQFVTFDGGGAASAVYPSGLNLGPIKFN